MKTKLTIVSALLACSIASAVESNSHLDPRYVGFVSRTDSGKIARSYKAVADFKRVWACPSTKEHTGACPGWAIDHVIPLACGGVDAIHNMQWLPDEIKSAKGPLSKDHFERKIYGGNGMSTGCP